jgi:hypothetical protein
MDLMDAAKVKNGMFPTRWQMQTGLPSNGELPKSSPGTETHSALDQFSVGAFADSAHEYLLKQWLLTSKSEPQAKNLCT